MPAGVYGRLPPVGKGQDAIGLTLALAGLAAGAVALEGLAVVLAGAFAAALAGAATLVAAFAVVLLAAGFTAGVLAGLAAAVFVAAALLALALVADLVVVLAFTAVGFTVLVACADAALVAGFCAGAFFTGTLAGAVALVFLTVAAFAGAVVLPTADALLVALMFTLDVFAVFAGVVFFTAAADVLAGALAAMALADLALRTEDFVAGLVALLFAAGLTLDLAVAMVTPQDEAGNFFTHLIGIPRVA